MLSCLRAKHVEEALRVALDVRGARGLEVGCGNTSLGEGLSREGGGTGFVRGIGNSRCRVEVADAGGLAAISDVGSKCSRSGRRGAVRELMV